jgi:hypothetical protein
MATNESGRATRAFLEQGEFNERSQVLSGEGRPNRVHQGALPSGAPVQAHAVGFSKAYGGVGDALHDFDGFYPQAPNCRFAASAGARRGGEKLVREGGPYGFIFGLIWLKKPQLPRDGYLGITPRHSILLQDMKRIRGQHRLGGKWRKVRASIAGWDLCW